MIPDLTRAAGAPRVAAIEFPFGRPLGEPHDVATQRAVLATTLEVLTTTNQPGTVVDLPFEWPEPAAETHWHPAEPSPIVQLLGREPERFKDLVAGKIPAAAARRTP